ncbi:MAG: SpoVR family protein [Candidatus Accumulibacter phosphatis]|uniref:SpoVR family protein n=4 Tax=Candidatus Accumulibacter TaxID=327159 RepID=A0A080M455_9PROT|nr:MULTISPECIES: SpoVR family protein [Candidatus Accumulibacter]KFB75260.1 MAG: SpoVR family protein [Candidatus Accumulibacter cognatus]MBN8519314.1 SpoVR family protein [Accumulibacter sp.]MBO3709374.1 SpoVR family protein [Accumulibacter sp.]MCC2868353.1 SpoVR family protein [Candidatus Accumulibacter phosphatis]MCM8580852.1 SpoVR family protein [Accumulibacter sp.]
MNHTLSDRPLPAQTPAAKLPAPSDWTFELLHQYHEAIRSTARRFGLDTYPNQLEIITAEQMMDAYASVGMPVNYRHWSYGKEFIATDRNYRRGQMGLAYEIVINANPCISYLMEENTMAMQALVIAHAAYGHNSFFKGNYLFRMWTDASSIIDYLVYAKDYVAGCEERHGIDAVELLLDSCHALMNYGVDRYRRPSRLSLYEERARAADREAYAQRQVNELWRTLPRRPEREATEKEATRFPAEPQENLLYFIEKNAPLLEPWQREIVRIVRKVAQYFYPQRQTQVMNEGWATFWHHHLLNTLYDDGYLTDGLMIEWLKSHTNVVFQPPVGHPSYNGINPYALGFAMYSDIKRICEAPSDEDRNWFPDIAGSDWLATLDHAMRNFKDESFIGQYLSPRLMRAFRLFAIVDDEKAPKLEVSAIHDEAGYRILREAMSRQYDLGSREPNIQVWSVNLRGDRSLVLRHTQHNERPLDDSAEEVLKHVARLWGFPVHLESIDSKGKRSRHWLVTPVPD